MAGPPLDLLRAKRYGRRWEQGHCQSYQSVPGTDVDHRPNGLHGLAIISQTYLAMEGNFLLKSQIRECPTAREIKDL